MSCSRIRTSSLPRSSAIVWATSVLPAPVPPAMPIRIPRRPAVTGSLTRARPARGGFGLDFRLGERGDVGEVAIALGVVEAVADDEAVGYRETDVVERHLTLAPSRLVEERRDAEPVRAAREQRVAQERERVTAVDHVLDQDDVAPEDLLLEILEEHGRSIRFGGEPVGRDAHEIDLVGDRNGLHQIGDEHDTSVQHADQERSLVGVVPGDLLAHLPDPPLDVRRADQNFHSGVAPRANSAHSSTRLGGSQIRRKFRIALPIMATSPAGPGQDHEGREAHQEMKSGTERRGGPPRGEKRRAGGGRGGAPLWRPRGGGLQEYLVPGATVCPPDREVMGEGDTPNRSLVGVSP